MQEFRRLAQTKSSSHVCCTLIMCVYCQFYFLDTVSSSPLQSPNPLLQLLSSNSSLLPVPVRNQAGFEKDSWPPTPFTFKNLNKNDTHPQWMHFISNGTQLPPEEGTSISWYVRSLILRLSELNKDDPCPNYVTSTGAMTEMELQTIPVPSLVPTVALCRLVMNVFEGLIEKWGAEVIAFIFGQGTNLNRPLGRFRLSLKAPHLGRDVEGLDQS